MLFKLISDGRTTQVELDGQRIGRNVNAVTFSHRRDGDANDCRVNIEFDLTVQKGSDSRDMHVFETAKPGEFVKQVQKYEEYEQGIDRDFDIIEEVANRAAEKLKEKAEACEAPAGT